jgi:hypothetical protein
MFREWGVDLGPNRDINQRGYREAKLAMFQSKASATFKC